MILTSCVSFLTFFFMQASLYVMRWIVIVLEELVSRTYHYHPSLVEVGGSHSHEVHLPPTVLWPTMLCDAFPGSHNRTKISITAAITNDIPSNLWKMNEQFFSTENLNISIWCKLSTMKCLSYTWWKYQIQFTTKWTLKGFQELQDKYNLFQ